METVATSREPGPPGSQECRSGDVELSIVIPCLNESRTLAGCIEQAENAIRQMGIRGEIIVADNGSTDGSQAIAADHGARVVPVETKGYGSAVRGGVAQAKGRYIVTGDADGSHDFAGTGPFFDRLMQGYDLVVGNRFQGGIRPGAMRPLHRFVGNPLLSWLGRLFFGSPVGDFHCGMRGFRKDAIERIGLRTTGFELCSEMVVKATLFGLRVGEVPITVFPEGRLTQPHLRTWRDGWRHLRFLLLYSPRWLFLYPGMALLVLGTALGAWLLPGPKVVGGLRLANGTLLFAAMSLLVGFEAVCFAVYTKVFAISEGLLPEDPLLSRALRHIKLETGLIVGALLVLAGTAVWGAGFGYSWSHNFGPPSPDRLLRIVTAGLVAITLGVQTILASFFLSVLGLPRQ